MASRTTSRSPTAAITGFECAESTAPLLGAVDAKEFTALKAMSEQLPAPHDPAGDLSPRSLNRGCLDEASADISSHGSLVSVAPHEPRHLRQNLAREEQHLMSTPRSIKTLDSKMVPSMELT
mmetsp:Transcript_106892/g.276403  ORF Transcript_106892/g.276403 Transcript_106892/m.276403 type:complete len:122 (-) Transcript_106892:1654-2019(-)